MVCGLTIWKTEQNIILLGFINPWWMFERPLYKSQSAESSMSKANLHIESVKDSAIVFFIQKENLDLLHLMLYEQCKTNKEH